MNCYFAGVNGKAMFGVRQVSVLDDVINDDDDDDDGVDNDDDDDGDDDGDDDDSLTPLGFPVIPTSFPGPSCSKAY